MLPALLLSASVLALGVSAQSTCAPSHSASTGFRLVLNVTDLSLDLTPSVHGKYLSTAHIGPAQNRAIVSPDSNLSPIFYQNGTFQDQLQFRAGILADTGSGLIEALQYLPLPEEDHPTQGHNRIFVSIGTPGAGTALTRLWTPVSYLTILDGVVGSSFVVCNATIPYYGSQRVFQVVNWVAATRDSTGTHVKIPTGCAPVRLVPQCAFLPVVEGVGHEFVQEVRCYDDVGGVEW
ncbi:hypothetical protein QBC35DRAFT_500296 [Podospora australis]|uniref:DUF7907 domain-containing protein n=1 Tax=Podospora australis TaxID=1536484 RepID=A0AAN7AI25_9PEZI|nr:hypothetical protein QBC35DRAFT_500296 [Podospora australis]